VLECKRLAEASVQDRANSTTAPGEFRNPQFISEVRNIFVRTLLVLSAYSPTALPGGS
jgi:hypothetical protein